MSKVIFVLGPTNAGKSTLLKTVKELFPQRVGLVEVGKEMRRRHPPEFFQGSAAPEHCEQEALSIFHEQMVEATKHEFVFVDGQPRRVSQITPCLQYRYDHQLFFLLMNESEEVLKKRLEGRFAPGSGEYELSWMRIRNDKVQLFDVLFELIKLNLVIETAAENCPTEDLARFIVRYV